MTDRVFVSDQHALYRETTPDPAMARTATPALAARAGTALTPGATATPAASRVTGSAIDAQLYGPEPLPAAGAGASDADVLFTAGVSSREALRGLQDTLSDVLGMDTAQRQAFNRAHVEVVRRSGLDPYVLGEPLAEAHVAALTAQRRGAVPDAEQTARLLEQEETFRRELRTQYGTAMTDDLLTALDDWIEDHPDVHRVLALPGFGQSPAARRFVEGLFEHVRKLHPYGR
jgi:hypothetical protein